MVVRSLKTYIMMGLTFILAILMSIGRSFDWDKWIIGICLIVFAVFGILAIIFMYSDYKERRKAKLDEQRNKDKNADEFDKMGE